MALFQMDWSLNLGDTALQLEVVLQASIQPSILVLCKRVLYCVTVGGPFFFFVFND
jgi:hypothetical protein